MKEKFAIWTYTPYIFTISHGSCKSQSWIWPLWRPYFHKSCFIISTIHSTKPFALGWSHEIVQWSISAFSHNFWSSPQNYVPWSMRILVKAPNLLSTLSKNAYVASSLLWSNNKTNSNHLEKCSIITKTYWLCQGVKLNGPTKSKLHWYWSLVIGKACRWGVGALKDAQT